MAAGLVRCLGRDNQMENEAPQPTTPHRTFAVVVLAILAVIAGLVAIADTLRYMGILPVAMLGELKFFGVNWFGAILAAICVVIWFVTARQVWNLDPRGWMFMLLISVTYLILQGLAILGQTTFQAVAPGVIVSAIALILTLLPSTKEAFGRA
jgi:hypothetical protein